MATSSNQSLQKTVIHQDLKFSVEFENGELSDETRIVNTKYERNTSKDIHLDNFIENDIKNAVSNKNVSSTNHGIDEVDADQPADQRLGNKKVRRVDAENVTEITVKGDNKKNVNRTSFSTLRGGKYKRLPGIAKKHTGGVRQRWEKPGDAGEIPIQARIRGPGPANYLLPTTIGRGNADATKRHSPAFSFGSRSWAFRNDSPGPAYGIDPLLGPKGKENRPSYSFGVKPKTPVRKFVTPGPGAYNTDSPPLWERRAPQYSISPRNKQRPVDVVPSPSTYALPTTLGDRVPHQRGAPAISIYKRTEKHGYAEDLANTPGPARYGPSSPSITKRKYPEYSVQGRSYFSGNKNVTPGPGAYNPQDVNSHLEQSPRHFIGVRHSEFIMPTLTPADCE